MPPLLPVPTPPSLGFLPGASQVGAPGAVAPLPQPVPQPVAPQPIAPPPAPAGGPVLPGLPDAHGAAAAVGGLAKPVSTVPDPTPPKPMLRGDAYALTTEGRAPASLVAGLNAQGPVEPGENVVVPSKPPGDPGTVNKAQPPTLGIGGVPLGNNPVFSPYGTERYGGPRMEAGSGGNVDYTNTPETSAARQGWNWFNRRLGGVPGNVTNTTADVAGGYVPPAVSRLAKTPLTEHVGLGDPKINAGDWADRRTGGAFSELVSPEVKNVLNVGTSPLDLAALGVPALKGLRAAGRGVAGAGAAKSAPALGAAEVGAAPAAAAPAVAAGSRLAPAAEAALAESAPTAAKAAPAAGNALVRAGEALSNVKPVSYAARQVGKPLGWLADQVPGMAALKAPVRAVGQAGAAAGDYLANLATGKGFAQNMLRGRIPQATLGYGAPAALAPAAGQAARGEPITGTPDPGAAWLAPLKVPLATGRYLHEQLPPSLRADPGSVAGDLLTPKTPADAAPGAALAANADDIGSVLGVAPAAIGSGFRRTQAVNAATAVPDVLGTTARSLIPAAGGASRLKEIQDLDRAILRAQGPELAGLVARRAELGTDPRYAGESERWNRLKAKADEIVADPDRFGPEEVARAKAWTASARGQEPVDMAKLLAAHPPGGPGAAPVGPQPPAAPAAVAAPQAQASPPPPAAAAPALAPDPRSVPAAPQGLGVATPPGQQPGAAVPPPGVAEAAKAPQDVGRDLQQTIAGAGGVGAALAAAASAPAPAGLRQYWNSLDSTSRLLAIGGLSIAAITTLRSLFRGKDDDDEGFLMKVLPFLGVGAAAYGLGGGTFKALPTMANYKALGGAIGTDVGGLFKGSGVVGSGFIGSGARLPPRPAKFPPRFLTAPRVGSNI